MQPLGAIYSLLAAVEQAGQEKRSIVRTLAVRADGVAAARETIRAVVPTPDERVLLGIADAQNVAALAIERIGCSHGHPVEWRHTLVRGDRFGVTAQLPFRGDPAPRSPQ